MYSIVGGRVPFSTALTWDGEKLHLLPNYSWVSSTNIRARRISRTTNA
ncbi:hypothetical protein [Micromonospora sp. NBC_01796]|nr:hypothetical protein [Micromonospora sp. NBC_01796]WSA89647.1 hypothetical protein OIE47_19650 [Micromonospora sp. NBC_01796]